jgi:hypothetical protein
MQLVEHGLQYAVATWTALIQLLINSFPAQSHGAGNW